MAKQSIIIVRDGNHHTCSQAFYQYQINLGYNCKSCKHRYHAVRDYLSWLEDQSKTIENTLPCTIQDYYQHLQARPSRRSNNLLSPKTIYTHIKIVESFYLYLSENKLLSENPCSALHFTYPKITKEPRTILSQVEIKKLYQSTTNLVERCVLSLAYGCGLRSFELENCNKADFLFQEKLLIVPKGKGNKKRVVPLSKGVMQDLLDYYYKERPSLTRGRDYKQGETAFILHSRGGRMRSWTYNRILKQLIIRLENEKLKEQEISIHSLRHSIATHLLEQGVHIEQVRLFLGHSHLETTQIYTRVNTEQLNRLIL